MRDARPTLWGTVLLALSAAVLANPAGGTGTVQESGAEPLPERLDETGLYVPGTLNVRADVISYTPQYPLWSDGAAKRRWFSLPPGTSIDATRAEAWDFPAGTKLWKEFRHGRAVETRFIERVDDGSWRFAAYVWNAASTAAFLAPREGVLLDIAGAPGGRYPVPSRDDCLACHEGSPVPVLGVSALQLSTDRDELAPHAEQPAAGDADLRELAARGLVANLPASLLENPPRIAADTPAARAALGYLHANCGHCHNDSGPMLLVDMLLAQAGTRSADPVLGSLIGRASDFRAGGIDTRVVPGRPEASMLLVRMRSRNALVQMPPLGTRIPDDEGIAVVENWIRNELAHQPE